MNKRRVTAQSYFAIKKGNDWSFPTAAETR